jgi:ribosomal protein S1
MDFKDLHEKLVSNISETLKIGDKVEGTLIPKDVDATVVAIGTYKELEDYDVSGACAEAVREGLMSFNDLCVAVEFSGEPSAVYLAAEVWKVS